MWQCSSSSTGSFRSTSSCRTSVSQVALQLVHGHLQGLVGLLVQLVLRWGCQVSQVPTVFLVLLLLPMQHACFSSALAKATLNMPPWPLGSPGPPARLALAREPLHPSPLLHPVHLLPQTQPQGSAEPVATASVASQFPGAPGSPEPLGRTSWLPPCPELPFPAVSP